MHTTGNRSAHCTNTTPQPECAQRNCRGLCVALEAGRHTPHCLVRLEPPAHERAFFFSGILSPGCGHTGSGVLST